MLRPFDCDAVNDQDEVCGEEVLIDLERGDPSTYTNSFVLYGHAPCPKCGVERWVETSI